jgi:protein-L-isoaspartate(D-aspartate) O-methyltransferase
LLDDAVAHAARAVCREHHVDHPTLGRIPQATAQTTIERDLRRAGIKPGQIVMEIGTGTGLTGALLAELVGEGGHVVSIDIDPTLTQRAATLHIERGVTNLTLLTRDGHLGAAEHGPYEVIIGWATPTHIPQSWIDQTKPGAVISTPVYLAEVARTVGHICAVVTDDGELDEPQLGQAVYIDMSDEINTSLGVPLCYIDALRKSSDNDLAWVSVAWRGHYDGHDPHHTFAMLQSLDHREHAPLGDTDAQRSRSWRDFRAYCAGREAAHPISNLTSYGIAGSTWESGIGFSSGGNAAVLTTDGQFIANPPDSPALATLRDYFDGWDQAARPGVEALEPVLRRVDTGWSVRTALPWPRQQ